MNCQTNNKPSGIICKNEGAGAGVRGRGPGGRGGNWGAQIFFMQNGLKMLFLSKMKIIIIGSDMVLDEPLWF